MANGANAPGPIRHRIRTRYVDDDGMELYAARYEERVTRDPSGSLIKETEAENTVLSSGEFFNPSMSSGPKPLLMAGACSVCRDSRAMSFWTKARRTHALCNVRSLLPCTKCGRPTCPLHRRQSRHDHQWRCPRCHRRHMVWSLLLAILFEADK